MQYWCPAKLPLLVAAFSATGCAVWLLHHCVRRIYYLLVTFYWAFPGFKFIGGSAVEQRHSFGLEFLFVGGYRFT
jgi:hypothetical protein